VAWSNYRACQRKAQRREAEMSATPAGNFFFLYTAHLSGRLVRTLAWRSFLAQADARRWLMTFEKGEGWRSGSDLYDLIQSVDNAKLTADACIKEAIEAKLGYSIDILKSNPDLIRELLNDRDDEKRSQAVMFLSKFDENLPDFEQIFRRIAVEDPAPGVRSVAIASLGDLDSYRHKREIVTFLHQILLDRDEENSVRKSAYWAMALIDMATSGAGRLLEPGVFRGFLTGLENDGSVGECIDADVIRRLMSDDQ
jgi:hypothetical protein